MFRQDRTKELVPDKKDGGGVLLAVKSTLRAKRRHDLETDMEILWVQVNLSNECKLYVATCYMNYPNSDMVKKFERSIEKVAGCFKENSKLLVFGDFNLSDIAWCQTECKSASITNKADLCPHSSYFTEILDIHALEQYNTLPSQPQLTTNVLDLVLCSSVSSTVEYIEKATISMYAALHVVVDISSEHNITHVNREAYNFKRTNWDEINKLLTHVDWSCLYHFVTQANF